MGWWATEQVGRGDKAIIIRGLESVALGKRRAFVNGLERRCESGTLTLIWS